MSEGARRGVRRTDTRDPRGARERALKILFQADVRGEEPSALLAAIVDDPRAWAMLDELDPEDVDAPADIRVDAASADADPEPHVAAGRKVTAPPIDAFTRSLVTGVADHRDELDELIGQYARKWSVSRMPAVDRSVLRLGAYELRYEVTAPAVVINECLELAKALSTDDSGRYVNGVLESVRKHVEAERDAAPDPDPAPVDGADGDVAVDDAAADDVAVADVPVDDVPVEEAVLVAAEVPDEATSDDAEPEIPLPAPDEVLADPEEPAEVEPEVDDGADDQVEPEASEQGADEEPDDGGVPVTELPPPDHPAVPVHEDPEPDEDAVQGQLF